MPEVAEVCVLSQYLAMKLVGKVFDRMEVLSGKYDGAKVLKGRELLNGKEEYDVINVESKGKLMWFVLKGRVSRRDVWLMSHLGLSGEWSFYEGGSNDRVRMSVRGENEKFYKLYYSDPRNFGNLEVLSDEGEFDAKVHKLAPDVLKTEFSDDVFVEWVGKFLGRSKRRKDVLVHRMLMEQNAKTGVVSGLGNYLVAEILYDAKISPFRTVGSLSESKEDMRRLSHSMKYVVKMTYYWGTTGYMSKFDNFLEAHRRGIDEGKYPDYHSDIVLDKRDEKKFEFKVYGKKKDFFGNLVDADRTIDPKRTTYWVPVVQK